MRIIRRAFRAPFLDSLLVEPEPEGFQIGGFFGAAGEIRRLGEEAFRKRLAARRGEAPARRFLEAGGGEAEGVARGEEDAARLCERRRFGDKAVVVLLRSEHAACFRGRKERDAELSG